MVAKCANSWCHATRRKNEGKLFRLDFDLGNLAGGSEVRTEYLWLCPQCAERMHPKVEVNGDTVTVRLSQNRPLPVTEPLVAEPYVPPARARLN